MNLFELSWNNWDEYLSITVSHPTKTKAEFIKDVEDIRINKIKDFVECQKKKGVVYIEGSDLINFLVENLLDIGYSKPNIPIISYNEDNWLNKVDTSIINDINTYNNRIN